MTVRDEPRALRDEDAFDVEAVHAWLAERLDGLTGPPAVRQFSGGASNLTYLLSYPDRGLVLDEQLQVIGVLDWEMATLGDPLMDLGGALAYWVQADDDEMMRLSKRQPTDLPGMPTRAEVVERYSAASGTAVDGWAFYEVFGLFRLAGIAQQIYLRYTRGQTTNPAFQHLGIFVTYLEARCAAIMGPASIGRA